MVTNPQIVEKTLRAQAAKKSKAAPKRKVNAEESNDEDGQKEVVKEKKKQKRMVPTPGAFLALIFGLAQHNLVPESDVDEDEPAVEITLYVYIEKPPPPRSGPGKSKINENDKFVQRGPFKLESTDSYATFLRKVADVLPCPILNIIKEKVTWKCQTPANAKALPMAGEPGYLAMVEALKMKKRGSRVAIVIMPPPVKPAEKPVSCL
jgi:hypothetical protein